MPEGAVWADPEFWGPKSPYKPGCWMCIEHPPDVKLDNSRLCLHCLARWWPGLPVDWVGGWLERQAEEGARRSQARKKRRLAGRQHTMWEIIPAPEEKASPVSG